MARWISEEGIFIPARVRVHQINETKETIINPSEEGSRYAGEEVPPGQDYIYEGPCLDAQQILDEKGVDHLGDHFTNNPDMKEIARRNNFKDVKTYATEWLGYNEEKVKEVIEKHKKKVHLKSTPDRKPGVEPMGGGRNYTSGKNSRKGGFGDEPSD